MFEYNIDTKISLKISYTKIGIADFKFKK